MPEETRKKLRQIVQDHMNSVDGETVQIVVAISGLLACVAYADRQYTASEQEQVRSELSRIHHLSDTGIESICALLKENITQLTVTSAQSYMRTLRELTDYDTRLEVLDVLMDLAAADDNVSVIETNFLRRTASGLGLSSEDYNAAQARHRDKLAVLKS